MPEGCFGHSTASVKKFSLVPRTRRIDVLGMHDQLHTTPHHHSTGESIGTDVSSREPLFRDVQRGLLDRIERARVMGASAALGSVEFGVLYGEVMAEAATTGRSTS